MNGAGFVLGSICALSPGSLTKKGVGTVVSVASKELTAGASIVATNSAKYLTRASATVAKESTKQALKKTTQIAEQSVAKKSSF